MPPHYALIGHPLTHTFSPAYFSKKFAAEGIDAVYESHPLKSIADLPQLLKDHPEIQGLNVTIPYKEAVIPYLHRMDATAAMIQAVNCISIQGGKLVGHNTDAVGFMQSLVPLLKPHHDKALILGTGGASKAVKHVLNNLGIGWKYVSRTPAQGRFTYDGLTADVLKEHTLIINTTPLGMHPDLASCPLIPYKALTPDHLLYDLIYNPAETAFLSRGAAQGAATKNGQEMLELQAEVSWQIWKS